MLNERSQRATTVVIITIAKLSNFQIRSLVGSNLVGNEFLYFYVLRGVCHALKKKGNPSKFHISSAAC